MRCPPRQGVRLREGPQDLPAWFEGTQPPQRPIACELTHGSAPGMGLCHRPELPIELGSSAGSCLAPAPAARQSAAAAASLLSRARW